MNVELIAGLGTLVPQPAAGHPRRRDGLNGLSVDQVAAARAMMRDSEIFPNRTDDRRPVTSLEVVGASLAPLCYAADARPLAPRLLEPGIKLLT